MVSVATLALTVNATVLHLLDSQRSRELHMRATWIFTSADVIANAAVILSGLAVLVTGIRFIALIAGACIGPYVIREALGILGVAREARADLS